MSNSPDDQMTGDEEIKVIDNRKPTIRLAEGLEGQDDNLDFLMSLFEDMQLRSADIANPELDLLSFTLMAHYFAVIMEVPPPPLPVEQEDNEKSGEGKGKSRAWDEGVNEYQKPGGTWVVGGPSALEMEKKPVKSEVTDGLETLRFREGTAEQEPFLPSTAAAAPNRIDPDLVSKYHIDPASLRGSVKQEDADDAMDARPEVEESLSAKLLRACRDAESMDTDDEAEDEKYSTDVSAWAGPPLSKTEATKIPSSSTSSSGSGTRTTPGWGDIPVTDLLPANPSRKTAVGWGNLPVSDRQSSATSPPVTYHRSMPSIRNAVLTKDIVGFVYLVTPPGVDYSRNGELNLGVFVSPKFRGKGYALDAVLKVLERAFSDKDCHRVQAVFLDGEFKHRAMSTFLKAGFGHEGTRRRAFRSPYDHEFKDLTYLGILATDWIMRCIGPGGAGEGGFLPSTQYKVAPQSLWDELFARHQREREELLRWEETRPALKRTASAETIRDVRHTSPGVEVGGGSKQPQSSHASPTKPVGWSPDYSKGKAKDSPKSNKRRRRESPPGVAKANNNSRGPVATLNQEFAARRALGSPSSTSGRDEDSRNHNGGGSAIATSPFDTPPSPSRPSSAASTSSWFSYTGSFYTHGGSDDGSDIGGHQDSARGRGGYAAYRGASPAFSERTESTDSDAGGSLHSGFSMAEESEHWYESASEAGSESQWDMLSVASSSDTDASLSRYERLRISGDRDVDGTMEN